MDKTDSYSVDSSDIDSLTEKLKLSLRDKNSWCSKDNNPKFCCDTSLGCNKNGITNGHHNEEDHHQDSSPTNNVTETVHALSHALKQTTSLCSNYTKGHVISRTSEHQVQDGIVFTRYQSEEQMADIIRLIQKDLSEPYSIYTYRYFIHNWPHLCFLALHEGECIGAIVCKLDTHKKVIKRGYIAMLAVDQQFRQHRIGSRLVVTAINAMIEHNADEVVLETETTNQPALRLYENLGFVRDKRLFRYYLNGVDALRLKLWLR
uniref:N-terminal methionine N(alpha)-acetyltransferase NatC n=1 Tax=Lynceus sp. MCZ IZ 141354 TaxID=1930659 RepID=A0A9N6WR74_9CRUS|nr:EOG090X07BN [Lynceus sp. MCZ IZ 141354]